MRIPSFLVRKSYVKGSLRNNLYGFQWEMRNVFASGTLWEVSLEIDGRACPLERVILHPLGGAAIRATEVNRYSPLRLDLGAEITVEGNPLPVGAHEILLRLRTKDMEEIELSLEDSI